MKKFFIALAVILLLLAGGIFYVYKSAPKLLSASLSAKMKVPVSISQITFGRGIIHVSDFTIFSPEGDKVKTALNVKDIMIEAPYSNYLSDPIDFTKIHLNNVTLGIEFYNSKRTRGNWITILANLQDSETSQEKDKISIQKSSTIGELLITNLMIQLMLSGQPLRSIGPVKELKFTNLDTSKGAIAEKITHIIVKHMMKSVFLLDSVKTIIDIPAKVFDLFIPFGGSSSSNKQQSNSN